MSQFEARGPGRSGHLSRHQSKVTFGLRLVDAYTGLAPVDTSIRVFGDQIYKRPVMKPNGDIVFSGVDVLPTYHLKVTSRHYVSTHVTVEMDALDGEYPLQLVLLHPSPNYPFHSSATLIRGVVRDLSGAGLTAESIIGRPISDGTWRARLAQSTTTNETCIRLAEFTGPIRLGDEIELRSRVEEPGETRRIISTSDENHRTFRIHEPLSKPYPRGTNLFPVYRAVSNELAEWVMPIRESCPNDFELEIQVAGRSLEQSVIVNGTAGSTKQVECVVLL